LLEGISYAGTFINETREGSLSTIKYIIICAKRCERACYFFVRVGLLCFGGPFYTPHTRMTT
jgi:hypothetical protein